MTYTQRVENDPIHRACGQPESRCQCCSWCQNPRCGPCPDCGGALCMGNGYILHHGQRCRGAKQ